jgi:hypothetical protein
MSDTKKPCTVCGDPPKSNGLCGPCYAWDRYHVINGHGLAYMAKYARKQERLLRRATIKLGKSNVRRFSRGRD